MALLQPDKNLTPALNSALEGLRDDLERARHLAAEVHGKVDGSSKECEALRFTLQKSFDTLAMLRHGIEELRRERHFFANEAMRAAALEIRMTDLTVERDRLQVQVEELSAAVVRK